MYINNTPLFPKDFIWGVADADLQVIGEASCLSEEGASETMWLNFAKKPGKVWGGDTTLPGVDRYHRWSEDIGLVQELGVRHYRTSVSMSRVLREDGSINTNALDWYERYFAALREADIRVYVTLYHWELPQFLAVKGGWKNRETCDWLVRHAKAVEHRLGSYIDEYFILNEPFQSTFESYYYGVHAPGESCIEDAIMTVHNILLAQGMVYRALKEARPQIRLGTVYNPAVTYAASSMEADVTAARNATEFQTTIFTDPVYRGCYPEYVLSKFGTVFPSTLGRDLEDMRVGDGLHSFGVNYYRGKIVAAEAQHPFGFKEVRHPQGITNGLGWPVFVPPTYPEGLYDLLTELHRRYSAFGMDRIYISENGTCWPDEIDSNGVVNDDFRIYYLTEHLRQVHKAILARVPVKAFFLWTLLDNFEWDLGYRPESCFGIVHVDRASMQRRPKKSYTWYRNVIQTGSLGA